MLTGWSFLIMLRSLVRFQLVPPTNPSDSGHKQGGLGPFCLQPAAYATSCDQWAFYAQITWRPALRLPAAGYEQDPPTGTRAAWPIA